MQQEQAQGDGDRGYTFFFQVASGSGRRACRVKVDATNAKEAADIFRQKWPLIAEMARNGDKVGVIDDRVVAIVTS